MERIILGICGYLYTNNKINLTNFSKLYISSNIVDEGGNFLYGGQIQKTNNNIIMPPLPNTYFDFDYTNEGKTTESIELPENWEGYIGICSHHSTSSTYYFDYQTDYMRNYTVSGRYIDIYELFAVKEDNWKTWAKLAGVDTLNESTDTLEEILANEEILQKIFSNNKSNTYLLKCTGTLMVEVLKNDISYNKIPQELKQEMKNNVDWNKFAEIFNREL